MSRGPPSIVTGNPVHRDLQPHPKDGHWRPGWTEPFAVIEQATLRRPGSLNDLPRLINLLQLGVLSRQMNRDVGVVRLCVYPLLEKASIALILVPLDAQRRHVSVVNDGRILGPDPMGSTHQPRVHVFVHHSSPTQAIGVAERGGFEERGGPRRRGRARLDGGGRSEAPLSELGGDAHLEAVVGLSDPHHRQPFGGGSDRVGDVAVHVVPRRRLWVVHHPQLDVVTGEADRDVGVDSERQVVVGDVQARSDRETATVEFKRSLSDDRTIVATVAAMATIGGGSIYVGVRDDGTVLGFAEGKRSRERLVQKISSTTDPKVYVALEDVQCDGLPVLHIRVPAGDGPHLADGRAYHRIGPATVAMTRAEYERRLLDRLRESSGFDRRVDEGMSIQDLDLDAVARFAPQASVRGPVPPESDPVSILRRLALVSGEKVSVAATLLFGSWPQGPHPQAVLHARAVRGAARDSAGIDGGVMQQIDLAVDFVLRNLRMTVDRSSTRRVETPELPTRAVREVIANAVAHRDYRSPAPIQLLIDDNGLTVWNPGHLPSPLDVSSLRREHLSIPCNPLLARALYLAGYIEEWGTGTLVVIEAMAAAGLPTPVFQEQDGGFRVILPFAGRSAGRFPPRATRFLDDMPPGHEFKSSQYAAFTGVTVRTAQTDLASLAEAGLVESLGQGRSARWVIR